MENKQKRLAKIFPTVNLVIFCSLSFCQKGKNRKTNQTNKDSIQNKRTKLRFKKDHPKTLLALFKNCTATTLPAVLVTFYFAFLSQFKLHTAISSYTLYAWLYVSLSGIVIYGFLKYFNGI